MKELEEIIEEINGRGRYQLTLLYVVFGALCFIQPLPWFNELLLLHVPDHWCSHPMTKNLNRTEMERWKACHIPKRSIDNSYGKCSIYYLEENIRSFWNKTDFTKSDYECPSNYVINNTAINTLSPLNPNLNQKGVFNSTCTLGWTFDQTEFSRTIPTDFNWVCNNSYRVPDIYAFSQVGYVIGSLGWYYMADHCGRRKTLWCLIALIVVPMVAKTFLAYYYYIIGAKYYCAIWFFIYLSSY